MRRVAAGAVAALFVSAPANADAGTGFAFRKEVPLTCVTKAPRPTYPVTAATDGTRVLALDAGPGQTLFDPATFRASDGRDERFGPWGLDILATTRLDADSAGTSSGFLVAQAIGAGVGGLSLGMIRLTFLSSDAASMTSDVPLTYEPWPVGFSSVAIACSPYRAEARTSSHPRLIR